MGNFLFTEKVSRGIFWLIVLIFYAKYLYEFLQRRTRFTIEVSQTIILYTLNLSRDACQLYLNRMEKNKRTKITERSTAEGKGISHSS